MCTIYGSCILKEILEHHLIISPFSQKTLQKLRVFFQIFGWVTDSSFAMLPSIPFLIALCAAVGAFASAVPCSARSCRVPRPPTLLQLRTQQAGSREARGMSSGGFISVVWWLLACWLVDLGWVSLSLGSLKSLEF